MEAAGPLSPQQPVSGLSIRQPQRELPQRSPLSPRRAGQDGRFARITPVGGHPPKESASAKWANRMRIGPAPARPLVPVTERKSQEENVYTWRIRRESEGERPDITPDGASASREGRHFTVANVGHHGRIYLRPTIRPANQRHPQPSFVFPVTPPSTAGLDTMVAEQPKEEESSEPQGSQWETPSHSVKGAPRHELGQKGTVRPPHRRRAHSDSTVRDTVSVLKESDEGAFKIIISKPRDELRSKTMEDLDPDRPPILDISIPTWRLGTPRFTHKGTPIIRGSSYAPTEEFRATRLSLNHSQRDLTAAFPDSLTSRLPSSLSIPLIQLPVMESGPPLEIPISRIFPPLRSTYLSTHLVIEPSMFDPLTFKPFCDDRSIVRYSSATGAVTAATPPRLVAEITSPSFLDYELLSDFFLTYRAFLEPGDLFRMLIARFRWSLERDDEVGMVVRVRTFVALRHWILNYFMDDFVTDYKLRVTFCTLLNDLIDDISQNYRGRKVQLKILSELKKCWRRVCAQYWDGPEFDSSLDVNAPIAPGGIAGHRNPSLDPSFWEKEDAGPPQLDSIFPQNATREESSFYADVSRAGHIPDAVVIMNRPGTPPNRTQEDADKRQTSPVSIMSVDVVSCSFPGKNMRNAQAVSCHQNPAHPVTSSSVHNSTGPVATIPRALVGKRVRPTHKRNASLTDSLREHSTDKTVYKDTEILPTVPYAGSLVRGNLLPPGHAFVEVVPPSVAGESQRQRQTTMIQPTQVQQKEKAGASAMSGQGMRRLIGSVRRALSTRGQGISPTHGTFINISPLGPRGATINRLPGTAIVPQARPRQNGTRPPVRIDLLGAEIAEDFKKAVREDAAADAGRKGLAALEPGEPRQPVPGEVLEYSAAHMDSSFEDLPGLSLLRPPSDMGMTNGSKSIVIVDDTVQLNVPAMHGALPAVNPSVEAFADTFLPKGADPTPPNTPPGHAMGTPRRSSYLLNQHIIRPSTDTERLPPFVPDMDTLGPGLSVTPSEGLTRPSMDTSGSMPYHLGIARGSSLLFPRQRSRGTSRSLSSVIHRRYASFQSGLAPQATVRSFDATTHSEGSIVDDSDVIPRPLRVVRRRPGGDLRAATTVTDLDVHPLRRSRSVGSLTTYTDSLRSSYLQDRNRRSSGFVDIVSSGASPPPDTFSLGAMAEGSPKRDISLFSTHSSKPIMRPSFEAEAKKLAQIPDDATDDGGVESALLKLEGKYAKKEFKLSMEPRSVPVLDEEQIGIAIGDPGVNEEEKKEHRHLHVGVDDERLLHHGNMPHVSFETRGSLLDVPSRGNAESQSFLSDVSRESYCSIPLLERGLTDDGRGNPAAIQRDNLSAIGYSEVVGSPEGTDRGPGSEGHVDSSHPSYDFVKKTDSMERIKAGETMPPDEEQSFLEDESDDENNSDLSSELSAEIIETSEVEAIPRPQGIIIGKSAPDSAAKPSRPSHNAHPPSPPMTLVQALQMSPDTANIPVVHDHQLWLQKPLPPTPDTTPTMTYSQHRPESPRDPTGTREALRGAPKMPDPDLSRKFSVHLPFILAFDSEILAQQFTLIEKDALNEIDWKELIDMGWKNAANSNSRSWVDFLRNTDAHGVEVVVARFNIMVKWAVSEIVLTQDIEERARCIIKYLHIAAHCRRYRNFATMAQIAIALSSQEIARLTKTWSLVPPGDMKTLRELEQLVSPTRNFYGLRAEMEGAADSGCIPFVGIYTHDLLFNAQRPSEIASSPTTAPLVNFERCRCSAAIIKTLLRLLEASTLYQFQPIEGITERCLWMSALTDEEIRRHSESLQ